MNLEIIFFCKQNQKNPAKEFIEKLQPKDRARVLACLKNIEELGFDCPRVQFRQIEGYLWEIKIKSVNGNFRFFYVRLKQDKKTLVILHGYKKQSQKAPKKEIEIAKQRMNEVLNNEKNYS